VRETAGVAVTGWVEISNNAASVGMGLGVKVAVDVAVAETGVLVAVGAGVLLGKGVEMAES
jgi:hypothetical protein